MNTAAWLAALGVAAALVGIAFNLRSPLALTVAVLALVATTQQYALRSAHAHGLIAPNVANHHRWIRIAGCESSGRWHLNTGNGYYGGLQFSRPTWSVINRSGYRRADLAPAWVQIANAERLRRSSSLNHWPYCKRYW